MFTVVELIQIYSEINRLIINERLENVSTHFIEITRKLELISELLTKI